MASHAPGEPSRLHWRALLRRTLLLLAIWLLVGPLLGIVLVERLNEVVLGGMPLGFWVAQQGAIYVFVVLIFVNAVLADRAEGGDAEVPRAAPPPRGEAAPGGEG